MKTYAISLVAAIALAMGSAGDVVQRVFISDDEELTQEWTQKINRDTDRIQSDFHEASNNQKEVNLSENIKVINFNQATITAESMHAEMLLQADTQRMLGWTDFEPGGLCGASTVPDTDNDTSPHGGIVFNTCDNQITSTHELLHTLGAVNPDAPGSDGRGHSVTNGDILKESNIDDMCDADNQYDFNVIDCGRNSYFNMDPSPGSWLLDNPEHNVAQSRFLRDVSEQEEPEPPTDSSVSRVSGSNRFATAVEVSKDRFPDGAQTAYVANGSAFADSMTAASYDDGPLLLVGQNHIPDVVRNELNRLSVRYIKIVGGSAVVSPSVESELVEYAN